MVVHFECTISVHNQDRPFSSISKIPWQKALNLSADIYPLLTVPFQENENVAEIELVGAYFLLK